MMKHNDMLISVGIIAFIVSNQVRVLRYVYVLKKNQLSDAMLIQG